MAFGTLSAALLGLVPSFHLVLSDGNAQLKGQSMDVVETVAASFREMGVEVSTSFDPSDPSLPTENIVSVIVLPRSSEEWNLRPGILAATRRESDSRALVVVFFKEVERILSARSLQGSRVPGRRTVNGVSRVIVHEILHYFLPGRPHDRDGVFMDHVGGNLLGRASFDVSADTRDALVEALRANPEAGSTR